MRGGETYCIDTSSLLEGYVRSYPPQVFAKLWVNIEQLIDEGRLVAPTLVYSELERKDDRIFAWVKERKQLFIPIDMDQLGFVFLIAKEFPALGVSPVNRDSADPFVIALAHSKNYMVVTNEKGQSARNPKIPQICRHFHVSHIDFLGMIRAEGWRF